MPAQMFAARNLMLLAEGALQESVDSALKRIHADLKDRPTLDKARKLQITLDFVPNALHDGSIDLEDVRVGFKVKISTPDLGPVQVQMIPKNDGLVFHPDVPEDPKQMGIMDAIDRGEA
jgi:hypothetical protein